MKEKSQCAVHPEREVIGKCKYCGRELCNKCLTYSDSGYYSCKNGEACLSYQEDAMVSEHPESHPESLEKPISSKANSENKWEKRLPYIIGGVFAISGIILNMSNNANAADAFIQGSFAGMGGYVIGQIITNKIIKGKKANNKNNS